MQQEGSRRHASPSRGGWQIAASIAMLGILLGLGQAPAAAQERADDAATGTTVGARAPRTSQEARERAIDQARARWRASIEQALAREGEILERAREAIARARQAGQRAQRESVRALVEGFGLGVGSSGAVGVRWILAHADDLGLSDEQEQKIRTAWREHRRASIERDAQIEVAELDLEELLARGDAADLDAVEDKMLEMARLRVGDRVAGLRLRRQVEQLLTPEQRDQLGDRLGAGLGFGWLRLPGVGGRAWFLGPERFELHGSEADPELRVPGRRLRMFRWRLHDEGDEDEPERCREPREQEEEGSERTATGSSAARRTSAVG